MNWYKKHVKQNKIFYGKMIQHLPIVIQYIFYCTLTVETVKIIGLSVPVVGNTPYDKESLSVPENAGYVIDSISWYSHSEGGWTVNQFEQGHKYQININLKLEDGYQFASNKNYVLDELDDNSYEKVQWGAVGDAQLSIIFKELE